MKTLILDFDGTIGDTSRVIIVTMRQTLAQLGLPDCDEAKCKSTIGLPLFNGFMALMDMSEEMGARCEQTYRELFERNKRDVVVPMFPHVGETIKTLYERGVTIAVASSRNRTSLMEFLDDMDLNRYLTCVVAASDVERAKPAPDMVFEILRQTGGRAEDALVVGDTEFDIEMGRNAGTKTCGVTYGNGTRESLANADFLIDDFGKLLLNEE